MGESSVLQKDVNSGIMLGRRERQSWSLDQLQLLNGLIAIAERRTGPDVDIEFVQNAILSRPQRWSQRAHLRKESD
jgi:hypothetical protein